MAKTNKKKKKHRVFWAVIKTQIVLMTLLLIAVGYYYVGGYAAKIDAIRSEARTLVAESTDSLFVPSQTVYVYDSNNNLISQKKGAKEANYVAYEDIPAMYVTAIISIEDKKFYSHNGVDIKGLARAVWAMLRDREVKQGGSTITMQLAKLIYMDSEKRDWNYKLKQMAIANELEKKYSKNKIMEFYLNNIYFSNGYYGIASACEGYFNKPISELDLSEICFLLAIPNSPTYYDPLTNYDNTIKRRDLILQNLLDDGKITEEQYNSAVNEVVLLEHKDETVGLWNNYVDTYTYYCATRALMEANGFEFKCYFDSSEEEKEYNAQYDEWFAMYQKELFTKGYSIYTSINMDSQNALQASVDTVLAEYTEQDEEGVYKMQASATCINNDTGLVEAIVGGRSQNFSVYTLNRAYQSFRQPGSSIKPLIVYTPCFERGYTKESIVNDYKFEDGPKNADNYYRGDVTIEYAVQQSLNTVAWQLYEELTPATGLKYLTDMNFTKIVDADYVLPTCLGGFTKGVSSLEMASAYATIENDGCYREPSCIVKIIDADQNCVYSNERVEQVVYSETASRMMTEVLQTVFQGTAAGMELENGMPAAVKTGTTNDMKDGWFCGYTRYYTTAVWVGYDMPQVMDSLSKDKYPGHIWQNFMNAVHVGKEPLGFLPYAQLSDDFGQDAEPDNPEESPEDESPEGDNPEGEVPEEENLSPEQ